MSIAVILLLAVTLIATAVYVWIEYKNIQAAKKKRRKPMATMSRAKILAAQKVLSLPDIDDSQITEIKTSCAGFNDLKRMAKKKPKAMTAPIKRKK